MNLLVLIVVCAVLWSLESGEHRREHVVPNAGLTAIVLLMNLALSFAAASVAGFAASHRAGLLYLLARQWHPKWSPAISQLLPNPITNHHRPFAKWSASPSEVVRHDLLNGPQRHESRPRPIVKWSATTSQMVGDHLSNGPRPFVLVTPPSSLATRTIWHGIAGHLQMLAR